jgi:hypothetical protein
MTSAETKTIPKTHPEGSSMALRRLDTEGAPHLHGADADMWRTLAAWLWTTYLAVVTGAVVWWVF